jgi:hypothetical protein
VTEPARIARLPHDRGGRPIPWNVLCADDGTPFFTINNDRKNWAALRQGLCPLCSERLGSWLWCVGGPLSAFHPGGCYLDLPGHRDCMEYALQVCPYLAAPKYLGRIDVARPEKLPPEARVLLDETVMPDRPEIFVAVACHRITVQDRGGLTPYLKPVHPFLDYTYWRHGRRITEDEAMPYLRAALGQDWQPPRRAE